MAAITSSNVTLLRSWEVASKGGHFREKLSDLSVVLTAQGGTAGDVPASALGFNYIYSVETVGVNTVGSAPASIVAWRVSSDGSEIIPYDNTGTRQNVTGTAVVRVTGVPKS